MYLTDYNCRAESRTVLLPDGIELRALRLPCGEVRNERQVRDLYTRPTELEYDDENAEVTELRPLIRLFAAQTRVEDERKAEEHANCACGKGLREERLRGKI